MIQLSEPQAQIKAEILSRFRYAQQCDAMSLHQNLNIDFWLGVHKLIDKIDVAEYPIEYFNLITENKGEILKQIEAKNINSSAVVDAMRELRNTFNKMDGL